MSQPRAQLDGLTGLRGLAAWLVVIYHVQSGAGAWMPPLASSFFAKGYLAVDLFFVLSGFVIWLNYAAWFEERGWAGYGAFLQKRLARIWPLHGFVMLIMFGLAIALMISGRPTGHDFPWAEFPMHFALIQNWGFTSALSWNHPAWSISTEFAAYLTFPLLVLAAKPQRWPTAGLIAAIVGICLVLAALFKAAGAIGLGSDIAQLGLIRCLCQFAIGCLICIIWQRSAANTKMTTRIAGLLFVGACLVALTGFPSEALAFPLAIAPLLLFLAMNDGARWNLFRSRPLIWLGEISYSTYLIHFVGWRVFKLLFVADAANVSFGQTALFLILILVGSFFSYHLIEQPGRRWFAGLRLKREDAVTTA